MQTRVMNVAENDQPTEEAQEAAQSEQQTLQPEQFESKESFARRAGEYLSQTVESFERTVSEIIEDSAKKMLALRQEMSVDSWYKEENLQYELNSKPVVKSTGEVDPDAVNAHKKAGLSLALFLDTCTTLPSIFNDAILNPGNDAFRLKGRGKRTENKEKCKFWTQDLRYQIQKGKWSEEQKAAYLEAVKHGTAIMRQSWGQEVQLVQSEGGNWVEEVVYSGLVTKQWPLLDVYVSNPNRPSADEQDAVIWESLSTLAELSKDERVWRLSTILDTDENEQPVMIPNPEMVGRYIGLDRLREADVERMRDQAFEEKTKTTVTETQVPDRVSAQRTFRKLEFQGSFPFGNMIRAGRLTPALMKYYEIDLNLAGEPVQGEEAARVAERIKWYITVIIDPDNTNEPQVIELRPCPYRTQRTELLAGQLIQTGTFYGMSTYRVGRDLEEAADKTLNDVVDILDSNADPKRLYSLRAFGDRKNKIEELLSGDEPIAVASGMELDQAIKYLIKPFDANMPVMIDKLIELYNTRTMCSQSTKGARAQTESDTLGESQQQIKQNERRLNDIIYRLSAEQLVVPSLQRALEDTDWFLSKEELADRARKYSTEYNWDTKFLFNTAEAEDSGRSQNVIDEIEVQPASMVTIGREVAIQFLLNLASMNQNNPDADLTKMYKAALDQFGGFDEEDFFEDPNKIKTPNEELLAIVYGDTVEPSMSENAMLHYQEHQNQVILLESLKNQYLQTGKSIEAIDGWIEQLHAHIDKTEDLLRMQMEMQQQQAEQQQAMAQQAPGGSKPPADEGSIQRGIQSNAAQGAQQ